MARRWRRFTAALLGAVCAAALLAGPQAGPATAATGPAHSLAAARTHAPIAPGAWVQDALTSSTQQNWYRVVLPASGFLSVVLGDLPKNYNLAVYDAAGTRLGFSDRSGTLFEGVDRSTAAAGTYFVRVASTSGASTARYALDVRLVSAPIGVLTVYWNPSSAMDPVGELVNTSSDWLGVALVDLVFRRADRTVVRTTTDNTTLCGAGAVLLAPHSRMPFEVLSLLAPPGAVSVSVVPHYKVLAPRTPARLAFTGAVRSYDAAHDRLVVKGTLTNSSGRTVPFAEVLLRGYSRRGVLVALGSSERRPLAAGARASVTTEYWSYSLQPRTVTWWLRPVETTDTV